MDAKLRVDPALIAPALLGWYDAHARTLPWRARGQALPDPYHVWLSEVMLQQTTVATVAPRFAEFVARWPDFHALAAADDADLMAAWAGLGYYARARNLLACARAVVADHGGVLPADEAALRALPGIGDYTAAAITAIAFGKRAVVIDGNVERVIARLAAIATPLPAAKEPIRLVTDAVTPQAHAGDFAQAMMDLGAMLCRPRAPACALCPLSAMCAAHGEGRPEHYPVKPARAERPQRHGTAFWIERGGAVLLVRRPPRGLLGGMRALPTGPWQAEPPALDGAPIAGADWHMARGTAGHVFTHFRLELALAMTQAEGQSEAVDGEWWPIDKLDSAGLPTVFAKAARLRREK